MVLRVLQVSRHVGSRLEHLGAVTDGTGKSQIPVSRHMAFEVMRPSTCRAANATDMRLFV